MALLGWLSEPFKWLLVTSNDRGWKGPGLNHLVGIVLLQPKPFHFKISTSGQELNLPTPADVRQFDLEKFLNTFLCCPPRIGKQLLAIVNKHNKKSRGRKRWRTRFICNSSWQEISFIDDCQLPSRFLKCLQTFPKLSQASRNAKMGLGCFFSRPKNLPLHNTPTPPRPRCREQLQSPFQQGPGFFNPPAFKRL